MGNMNFIYICRIGENEELRYSVRSVLNSFPEAVIWVIGGKPDWYVGNYIYVDQNNSAFFKTLLKSFICYYLLALWYIKGFLQI